MIPGALVLLGGPLDAPSWWRDVATDLAAEGRPVVAPATSDRPPYGASWVAITAQALHLAAPGGPLVLVAHGTAGPLLPALARTQRPAGRRVGGFVFVDATLPRPGPTTHLDLLRAADPDAADAVHDALHEPHGSWPPDAAQPRDHEFWTAALPAAIDWPDAPCAYVTTGAASPGCGDLGFWARSAAARGWPVATATDLPSTLTQVVAALPG